MWRSIRLLRNSSPKSVIEVYNCYCLRRRIHTLGLNDIPKVTVADIRKILRQKGFAIQDGFTSLTTKCSVCSGEQKSCDGKLYINKTTGYFLCPKCNVHGDWNILERIVKKTKIDTSTKDFIAKSITAAEDFQKDWKKVIDDTTSLSQLSENDVVELFRLFEYPYHHEASKTLSEVRVSTDHTVLYFPLKNSLDKTVGYRKIQAGKEDEVNCHGLHTSGLFSCKVPKLARTDQAILVPSIHDVLHLAAHKVPGTLIWLSNCSLPPMLLPSLENYQKLCLWGDWDNMRAVAEKLGEERCRFVRPTDGLVTASEASRAGVPVRTLVADAKPAAHRSITTFAALRDDVYAELTNIDKVRGVKWRRFPALTRLLGGHRRGELTVLTGPTGAGKTTLCAEMSLDLAQQGASHAGAIMFYLLQTLITLLIFHFNYFTLTEGHDKSPYGQEILLCRKCGADVADSHYLFSKSSPGARKTEKQNLFGKQNVTVQTLVNLFNVKFDVITLEKARCENMGPSQGADSWFPGYTWRICACPHCGQHLGWTFENSHSVDNTSDHPHTFHGLILTNILGENFTDSLIMMPKMYKM